MKFMGRTLLVIAGCALAAGLVLNRSTPPTKPQAVVVEDARNTPVAPEARSTHDRRAEVRARLQALRGKVAAITQANAELVAASERYDKELAQARALRAQVLKGVRDIRNLSRLDDEAEERLAEAADMEIRAQEAWSAELAQFEQNIMRR